MGGTSAATLGVASVEPAGRAPGSGSEPEAAGEPRRRARRDRRAGRSLDYRPGFDGLRALALLAVMAFHHGYRDARGGYLGVSSFFTLSGFLIATLALAEWDRTGRLSWARFWERRARRLLPAAFLTLAGVVVVQWRWGIGAGPRLRGDLLAALGYVTNWRLATTGHDYGAMFSDPSPLVHLWSLAIEEQFYLLFPLVFAGVMAAARGRRRQGAVVFGAAAGLSFAVACWSARRSGNDGATYYGTHTRAGELLVGVTLAFVLASPRVRRALRTTGARAAASAAGLAGLAGMAWLWHSVRMGDARLFGGVTALNAACTAAVVAAVAGAGWFDRTLGIAPLRAVGKVSYGAYLFHWPLFLLIAGPRAGLQGHQLFLARLAATLGLATVSYLVVEAPFRFRLPMPRPRLALVLATGALAVVVVVSAVPPGTPPAQAANPLAGLGPVPDARRIGAVTPAARPATDTVLLAGDSVAYSMLAGFDAWNEQGAERQLAVDTHIAFGCPIGGPGLVRGVNEYDTWADCTSWHRDLTATLDRMHPDVIVLVMGLADLGGRRLDGRWHDLGDATYDRWLSRRIDRLATTFEDQGVPVLWLTFPHIRARDPGDPTRTWDTIAINDPARVDRLNALSAAALADHPGVTRIDLAGWLDTWPDQSFDPANRDGVHFSFAASARVAAWLIPQVLATLPPR
ncbi:MAG TPA: acyltransferase family protein [Acidimicrobiales bacterium]